MSEKKQEIMKTAMRLFSERGYFSTPVQDIAHDCSISKGALYKHFESKEDLLIQVIEHNRNKMFQKAGSVNLDDNLTPKERLIEKIVVELEDFLENKNFIHMLFRALPVHDNPQIVTLMQRTKATLIQWHKDCLMQAYGKEIEPVIWDFVIMLQGVLKEYISLMADAQKAVNIQQVARSTVDRFDAMIRCTRDIDPVLSSEMMSEYDQFDVDFHQKSNEEQFLDLLGQVTRKVKNMSLSEREREELLEAIELLQKEVNESKPRQFLMNALLSYLGEWEELKSLRQRVETKLQQLREREL